MIYIISDNHFGHKNIIKHENRPFVDEDVMDDYMIKRWNSIVEKNDTVYHLGDMFLCKKDRAEDICSKLNGKIHLIIGNHDKTDYKVKGRFEWVKEYYELKYFGQKIVLFHYPIESWNKSHHGSYHFHGHSHGHSRTIDNRVEFSVECNWVLYQPVHIDIALINLVKASSRK